MSRSFAQLYNTNLCSGILEGTFKVIFLPIKPFKERIKICSTLYINPLLYRQISNYLNRLSTRLTFLGQETLVRLGLFIIDLATHTKQVHAGGAAKDE